MLNSVYVRLLILLFTDICHLYGLRILLGWLMIFLAGNVNSCNSFLVVITGILCRDYEHNSLRDGHLFFDGGCPLTRSGARFSKNLRKNLG